MIRAKKDKKKGPRERKTYRLSKDTIKLIEKIAKANDWATSEAIEEMADHFYECPIK